MGGRRVTKHTLDGRIAETIIDELFSLVTEMNELVGVALLNQVSGHSELNAKPLAKASLRGQRVAEITAELKAKKVLEAEATVLKTDRPDWIRAYAGSAK